MGSGVLSVLARAAPVHDDRRLVPDDPGVVAARQRSDLAGPGDELGAVVHADAELPRHVILEVRGLAAHRLGHFPTKAELGRSLIERYQERFLQALGEIDRNGAGARQKLRLYVQLYTEVLRRNRMCLCGMLASDFNTLPKAMKESVKGFFDANEAWLAGVLQEGRRAKRLRSDGSAQEAARVLVGSLEGAMLLARSYGDVARFESAAERLLADLGVGGTRAR